MNTETQTPHPVGSSAWLAAVEESCRVEMADIQKSLAEKTCVQDYAYIAMVTVTIFERLAKRAVEKAANEKAEARRKQPES